MEKRSFFFARRSGELPGVGQRILFYLWGAVMLLLSSAGLCVLSLLLGIGMMDIQLFWDYFRHPLLFLLNWLPVLLFQLILLALINRQWLAFLGTALIFMTASAGNFYKLKYRSEPFLFSDLSSIRTAVGVAGNYDMTPNTRILLSAAFVLLCTLFLLLFVRGRMHRLSRWVLAVLVLLSLYPAWRFLYADDQLYNDPATRSEHVVDGWVQQLQVSKGFEYQFLRSAAEGRPHAPEGYSDAAAEAMLSTVKDADIPPDQKVNLLVFQLEAFSDLNTLGIPGIAEKTYEDFYRLKDESLSGMLIADVFAGGTVNTERCFLTGSTYMHDYRSDADSYVWYLDGQGYTTVGSHPHYESYYNRLNINRYLGFSDYWYRENHYEELIGALPDPWLSDPVVIPEVTKQFLRLAESSPVFSFNATMQGHGPYNTGEYVYDDSYWNGSGYSDTASYVLNNYLGSIHETAALLWDTVETLRQSREPVVLLVYGDHKPWLGDSNSVYQELGVDLNPGTWTGFTNYYSTPYLLWANEAAEEVLGHDISGEGPAVSPGFLMKLVFDQLGWQGDRYMQLSNQVYQLTPIVHTGGYYWENEAFTKVPGEAARAALQRLTWLEYYRDRYFTVSGKFRPS